MPFDHHFALIVGIDYYPGFNDEKDSIDLMCPSNDANAFKGWLVNGGDVPEDNIIKITSQYKRKRNVKNAEPNSKNVIDGFREINKKMAIHLKKDVTTWKQSRLYVFFFRSRNYSEPERCRPLNG